MWLHTTHLLSLQISYTQLTECALPLKPMHLDTHFHLQECPSSHCTLNPPGHRLIVIRHPLTVGLPQTPALPYAEAVTILYEFQMSVSSAGL